MEQMSGPGTCGSSFVQTGTGSRSNRSRRGSSRADAIEAIMDAKEKTVNFANCVSPPSPHDPGFMGINNEAYPCDCCQIDESQFRRSYNHQMPCGPSGMMHFSEVRTRKLLRGARTSFVAPTKIEPIFRVEIICIYII